MSKITYHPIILCILDGFGINSLSNYSHDATNHANTPCLDFIKENFPHMELLTSGEAVGLPADQMGNSEVGHITIGSGRVVLQDLFRINKSIEDDSLKNHILLKKLIKDYSNTSNSIHLLGLCSDGGVHSHINHLIYISKLLASNNIHVKLHLFLDGRDVGPQTAKLFLEKISNLIEEFSNIKIATISGRFYAMDRDHRWERIEECYKAIASAEGKAINSWSELLENEYKKNIFDEFIPPAIIGDYQGIDNNDSILFFNFRSDRVRQLAQALLSKEFNKFPTKDLHLKYKIGMTHYSNELDEILETLFPEQIIKNNLSEILSQNNKKQLRIAETEKYAHVTFFFNSGIEEAYKGEERILIPSPKVRTYDLAPEMSAFEVTEQLVEAIKKNKYDLIVVNYANCDMVGHSGNLDAAIKAVETIDSCLKKIFDELQNTNALLMITADHGNVEYMHDIKNNSPHTSHTTNPVPLFFVASNLKNKKLELSKGTLSDISPTILKLMDIKIPIEMTGKPIL